SVFLSLSFQDAGLLVVSFLLDHVLLPRYLLPAHTYPENLASSRKDSLSSASHQLRCIPPGLPNKVAPTILTSSTLEHVRFHHSEHVGCHGPFQTLHGHPLSSR